MSSATNAKSLAAPGVVVNENDLSNYENGIVLRSPVCLMFGFSPIGALMEPKFFNSIDKMTEEFGIPENTLEKYFMNAGAKVIQGGGTALMTRLPYDNFQANNVKYIRYSISQPIHRHFVYQNDESYNYFKNMDSDGLEVLEVMHKIDDSLNGYSRISTASTKVESMTIDQYNDVCLDSSTLEEDSIYIFDIKKLQLGKDPLLTDPDIQYLGTVPVIVSASTALYVQEKIKNNAENDKIFNLLSIPPKYDDAGSIIYDEEGRIVFDPKGVVTDCDWIDPEVQDDQYIQTALQDIVGSFSQVLGFNHNETFYDKRTVSDDAALTFPLVRYSGPDRLERKYFDQLGIIIFEMVFNEETEKVDFILRESFCGYICNVDNKHPAIDIQINNYSKYIHIIRNVRNSSYRDYFHVSDQPLVIFGMKDTEMEKKINYNKSIIEPIQHMLDSEYTDVDSCIIDIILDAGISTAAHFAWRKCLTEGDEKAVIYYNPSREDITPTLDEVGNCAMAWNKLTKMITKFIEYRRGECIFIADGPRCLNLSRNQPLLQHYPHLSNMELFNRYLKYFSDVNSSFGAKFFNWVLTTDYYSGLNIWMPPSVLVGQIMCDSERAAKPWYAPAGFNRGIAPHSYSITLRTKPYTQENDILQLHQWNYFTQNVSTGIVLEGNKTMQLERTALDRINVRRLCNYIKRQIRNISNRYKYEPNTAANRMQYAEELRGMLMYIQRNSGISDFVVICNDSNNPNEVIERNELRAQVWIKPIKAIEYIIIDLNVTSQDVKFQEGIIRR